MSYSERHVSFVHSWQLLVIATKYFCHECTNYVLFMDYYFFLLMFVRIGLVGGTSSDWVSVIQFLLLSDKK